MRRIKKISKHMWEVMDEVEGEAERTPPNLEVHTTFFQKTIIKFDTREDDNGEFIAGCWLNCGHYYPYKRRRPVGSKRKTAPCKECGSGSRSAHNRRIKQMEMAASLKQAVSSEDTLGALVELFEAALAMTAYKPGDAGWAHHRKAALKAAFDAKILNENPKASNDD